MLRCTGFHRCGVDTADVRHDLVGDQVHRRPRDARRVDPEVRVRLGVGPAIVRGSAFSATAKAGTHSGLSRPDVALNALLQAEPVVHDEVGLFQLGGLLRGDAEGVRISTWPHVVTAPPARRALKIDSGGLVAGAVELQLSVRLFTYSSLTCPESSHRSPRTQPHAS